MNAVSEDATLFQSSRLKTHAVYNGTDTNLNLRRTTGRNITAELYAKVEPNDAGASIIGEARVGAFTWYFLLLFLPVFSAIMVPIVLFGEPSAVFIVFGLVPAISVTLGLYSVAINNRRELVDMVRGAADGATRAVADEAAGAES